MAELLDRARQAVSDALAAGATGAWASADRGRSTEIAVRDGAVEKVQSATSRSLSLQVWADGRWSSSSTTDLSPDRLAAFVRDAVAMTRALPVDPFREMPDPALFAGRSAVDLALVDPSIPALTPAERERVAREMEAACHGDPRVISATAGFQDDEGESAAVSSNGFEGDWSGTSVSIYADVTVRDEGDRRPEGDHYHSTRRRSELPDAASVGKRALELALSRVGAQKGPTQKSTLIVDPRAAGNLVARLLGPNNAQSIFQGRSFWAQKLGQKVVSPLLTLTDEPLLPGGLASRRFDREGIASRPRAIVQDGVLAAHYVDTYYGKKAKLAPNGGSASNRIVKPGTRDLAALVRDVNKGIYVTSWLGGNADPTTLDFSFGLRGHLVENGKIGAPVGEMNVTGNLPQLFGSLVAVGSDPWMASALQVPTLVFEGVEFSGV